MESQHKSLLELHMHGVSSPNVCRTAAIPTFLSSEESSKAEVAPDETIDTEKSLANVLCPQEVGIKVCLHTSANWLRLVKMMLTVDKVASRGFTMRALLSFLCCLLDPSRSIKQQQLSVVAEQLQALDAKWDVNTSSTRDTVKDVIIPLTVVSQCSLSHMLMKGMPCYPRCIVTHTWANLFIHTVAAIVADALGEEHYFSIVPHLKTYDRVCALLEHLQSQGKADSTYWLCAISINQHTVMCDELSGCLCTCPKIKDYREPDCQIGHFDKVVRFLKRRDIDFYQVVAWDQEIFVEIQQKATSKYSFAVNCGSMRINMKKEESCFIPHKQNLMPGDVLVSVNGKCGSDALMELAQHRNRHVSHDIEMVVKREGSVITRIWVMAEIAEVNIGGIKQRFVTHWPLALSGRTVKKRLLSLDVRLGEASLLSDRDMILSRIEDYHAYNERLRLALFSLGIKKQPVQVIILALYSLGSTLYYTCVSALQANESSVASVTTIVVCTALLISAHAACVYYIYWLHQYRFLLKAFFIQVQNKAEQHMLQLELRSSCASYLSKRRRPTRAKLFLASGVLSRKAERRAAAFVFIASQMFLGSLGCLIAKYGNDSEDSDTFALFASTALLRTCGVVVILWVHQEETGVFTGQPEQSMGISFLAQLSMALSTRDLFSSWVHFAWAFFLILPAIHIFSSPFIQSWCRLYGVLLSSFHPASMKDIGWTGCVELAKSKSFNELDSQVLKTNSVDEAHFMNTGSFTLFIRNHGEVDNYKNGGFLPCTKKLSFTVS